MSKLFIPLLLIGSFQAASLRAHVLSEMGRIALSCGVNSFEVEYKITVKDSQNKTLKSALLLSGSPATEFFSQDGAVAERLVEDLRKAGYKVMEIRYPDLSTGSSRLNAQGFYKACFNQGFDSIKKHTSELYVKVVEKLQFNEKEPEHELVAVGYSLGALQLQIMALHYNKPFTNIALIGVLFGDVEKGCLAGLEHQRRLASNEEICSEPLIASGIGYGSFMHYIQQVTSSGNGCCIPNGDGFGACTSGRNEYTADLNIENQPYFDAYNLEIFEGAQACSNAITSGFSFGNPGQAQHIAKIRTEAGKETKARLYEGCGHDVLGCAGDRAREDILRFLAPLSF